MKVVRAHGYTSNYGTKIFCNIDPIRPLAWIREQWRRCENFWSFAILSRNGGSYANNNELESVEELEREFSTSMTEYFKICKEKGKQPDKPYFGRFNVRLRPRLHGEIADTAIRIGDRPLF